eukprot:TRINITY_DN4928_c0_g1_i2.p1 TRINITY_DN4928_c0_g1~~TRINITY_DN4928_c0_g1_i2.p1  ORF type:complete len:343 (-),score=76.38 TRINITY_DN4928_c0_g1_i2:113-1141(-)
MVEFFFKPKKNRVNVKPHHLCQKKKLVQEIRDTIITSILCLFLYIIGLSLGLSIFISAFTFLMLPTGKFIFTRYIHKAVKMPAKERRPKRIILIRHGQSEGNADSKIYSHIPDNQVKLTNKGIKQAIAAGKCLKKEIPEKETVRFFVSPYKRSRQTFENILVGWKILTENYTVREEPRLREQDWGNFQDYDEITKSRKERQLFGSFYYRFPRGESGADVFDRVSSFWGSLHREFKNKNCLENFVIVSHGITIRMMLMRYFKWSVEEYHQLWNPENCQIIILEKQPNGSYKLKNSLIRNRTPEEQEEYENENESNLEVVRNSETKEHFLVAGKKINEVRDSGN